MKLEYQHNKNLMIVHMSSLHQILNGIQQKLTFQILHIILNIFNYNVLSYILHAIIQIPSSKKFPHLRGTIQNLHPIRICLIYLFHRHLCHKIGNNLLIQIPLVINGLLEGNKHNKLFMLRLKEVYVQQFFH